MQNSFELVKVKIYQGLSNAAIIIFGFIGMYTPLSIFLQAERHFALLESLVIFASLAVVVFLLQYKKASIAVDVKITVVAFVFLTGVSLVIVSIYPTNPLIYAALPVALIPLVLLHSTKAYLIYNAVIFFLYYFTVFTGRVTINTAHAGFVDVGYLAVAARITGFVVLFLGVIILYFVRRSIMEVFKELHDSERAIVSLVKEIQGSASTLVGGAEEVGRSTNEVAEGNESQASIVQEISRKVESLASVTAEIAANARHAASASVDSRDQAEQGAARVEGSIAALQSVQRSVSELAHVSKRIGNIVEVIEAIAAQTELLALNAAIEAARAGEHGRGFAVVAGAVRSLSDESRRATREIGQLIEEIQSRISESVSISSKGAEGARLAQAALSEILKQASSIALMVQGISDASIEQAANTSEVASSIENLAAIAQQVSASSEETAAAGASLAELGKRLRESTGKLRT